ncbi:hypothetical protein HMPREF1553_02236 [Porphyromonas gingivalis F0568]|nr:hypothetical protein HMPREF1553_02236 [Porphyromonas gingivalis F0568]
MALSHRLLAVGITYTDRSKPLSEALLTVLMNNSLKPAFGRLSLHLRY